MEEIKEENGVKLWKITIDSDEVLSRIVCDTNYREHAMESGGEKYILMESDITLFNKMFKSVVTELWLKIGRMSKNITKGIDFSDDSVRMILEVSENHDDNMLFSLSGFIEEFIDHMVLHAWYVRNNIDYEVAKCDLAGQKALKNIITVVHYRKKAVKRPINPIF